jgi:hypothetical protein
MEETIVVHNHDQAGIDHQPSHKSIQRDPSASSAQVTIRAPHFRHRERYG